MRRRTAIRAKVKDWIIIAAIALVVSLAVTLLFLIDQQVQSCFRSTTDRAADRQLPTNQLEEFQ